MPRLSLILSSAVIALSVSACATNDDPSKGGFFSGVKNMSDGTYQKRVDDRQQTLENEQDTNIQQNRALDRAKAQSDAVRADRDAAEAKYTAFRNDLESLRGRLAKAQTANAKKKTEVASLNQQIDALQAKVQMVQQDTFTPDADRQKRLDALKVERDALDREVEMLIRR